MGVMARWLTKSWEVSGQRILAPENLSTSKTLKKETNEDRDGGNPTNQRTFEAVPLTFEYTASLSTGVDPLAEYESMKAMVGKKGPFYLGGARFGPPRLQLDEVRMDARVLGADGRILEAGISLSLIQDGEPGGDSGGDSPAGIGRGSTGDSAVGVGPSAAARSAMTGG